MPELPQEQYGYKVVLDKQRWLRGAEACKTPVLYDAVGRYDIAAKMMLDIGYSSSHLKGKRWPCQVVQAFGRNERIMEPLRWMVSKAQADTEECVKLITINDDPTIDDDTRIKEIQKIINPYNLGLIVTDSSVKKEEKKSGTTSFNAEARDNRTWAQVLLDEERRRQQERLARLRENERRGAFITYDTYSNDTNF